MIIGLDQGHRFTNSINSGANGILREVDVNRAVGKELINILRSAGHTVIDCTDNYSELEGRVTKANAQYLDLFISLHCNAFNGNAYGTETHIYNGNYNGKDANRNIATNVNNAIINAFGFTNRGVKESDFYVLRNTKAPAILIEMFFIDSAKDCGIYNGQVNKMATAIANGLGITISNHTSSSSGTSNNNTNIIYRVRKSWSDNASQKGAFSDLGNAKQCANNNPGYAVFDANGNKVYPIVNNSNSNTVSSGVNGNCDRELSRYTEYGKCTITTGSGIIFRDRPCTCHGIRQGLYYYNESVNYDLVVITEKYVWISWIGQSGTRRYMPIKDKSTGERWGNCV